MAVGNFSLYVLCIFFGCALALIAAQNSKKVPRSTVGKSWLGAVASKKWNQQMSNWFNNFASSYHSQSPHYYLDSSNEGHAKCTDHQLQFRLTMHQTEHLRHTSNNTKRISLLNPQQFHRKTVQLLLKPKVSSPQVGGWSCSTIKSLP